jgi:aspartyl-tRNA synthetase
LNNKQKKVTLNGHLNRKPRVRASNSFAEFRDQNGDLIQLYFAPNVTDPKFFDILKTSGPEESVSITGHVQLKQMKPGDTTQLCELVVENYQVLNSSNLDGARLDKLKHSAPEDLPPQFRYLQLRTPFYQKALRVRSKIATLVRNTLINNHDFVEIETPLLFKSTPEGAREFLVPTRTPDRFYALPQSPQQYKQILMSSGFTRYFQIARCFRDEDLRSDRQPEFTQIDMEMSYISNTDQVGIVVEDLIHNIWNKVGERPTYTVNEDGYLQKVDFNSETKNDHIHFNKLKYIDALTNYGIDKPDLRSGLKFEDLSRFFEPVKGLENFPVLELCKLKNAFDPTKKYKINHVLTDSNNYTRRKPIVLAIKTNEDATSWYNKFLEKQVFTKASTFNEQQLTELLDLNPGDIIAFSTRARLPYENPTPLGKFRQLAISEFPDKWKRPILNSETKELTTDYNTDDMCVGSWVVDFPLFNPVETSDDSPSDFPTYDYTKYESTHHPFTMAKTEDYELLETDPLKVRGEHYDLVINGVEVGGGSRRIHDAALQQYIFENILQIKNYNHLFGHLLLALSMGCPPHAGLALGFDRLCAMLIGSNSIRDVIAFPKNQSGVDPVVESPTSIGEETLNQYHIKVESQ